MDLTKPTTEEISAECTVTNKKLMTFSVQVYGNLEPYSPTMSKARVRVFYRGKNRNGSYIDDNFAEQLLSTIPYAPIKGIYSEEKEDFEDHGKQRSEGRIYGVVSATPNLQWEDHEDEDGVVRTYACVDGFIYTALYEEAHKIVGKAQSMEIYQPSIKGVWEEIDGLPYFRYTQGCFLGLQVLGDETEPCFEGAAFFSLIDDLMHCDNLDQSMYSTLQEYAIKATEYKTRKKGGNTMPQNLFKLSDEGKARKLFDLLNPVNENGDINWNYYICNVYDDYAVVQNLTKDNSFERVYYTKDNDTDTVTITSQVPCFIVDVTEAEKHVLDTLWSLNGNTFEELDNKYQEICKNYDTKKTECEELNATLNTEREEFARKEGEFSAQINSLTDEVNNAKPLLSELDGLRSYKYEAEKAKKMDIINSYSSTLAADIIEQYVANIDKYELIDLDMHLTYDVKRTNPSIFSKEAAPVLIPKVNAPMSGISAILENYRDKK